MSSSLLFADLISAMSGAKQLYSYHECLHSVQSGIYNVCLRTYFSVSSQVHSRTFDTVVSRVLFVVCCNYQGDICLTSQLVPLSQQLCFSTNIIVQLFKVSVRVVLMTVQ